jgi:hypothetical protein
MHALGVPSTTAKIVYLVAEKFMAQKGLTNYKDVVTLLVNAKTRGKAGIHTTVESQSDRDYASGPTHSHGIGDCLLRINQQSLL